MNIERTANWRQQAGLVLVEAHPAFDVLSLMSKQKLEDLLTASGLLRSSSVPWLVQSGEFFLAATDASAKLSTPIEAWIKGEEDRPGDAQIWVWIGQHLSEISAEQYTQLIHLLELCSLYWWQRKDSLRLMHEFLAEWPEGSRTRLSQAVLKSRSVNELCSRVADFRVNSQDIPFGAAVVVVSANVERHLKASLVRGRLEANERILVAGGDMFLCRDLPGHVAVNGPGSVLAGLAPVLDPAHAVLANLECVVSTGGEFADKGERRPFYYHAPPEVLDVLIEGGVSCVTTANNHSMDYGPDALMEQSRWLSEAGLAFSGTGPDRQTAARPAYLDLDGLTVAVLSFETEKPIHKATDENAGSFHVPLNDVIEPLLRVMIGEAREYADVVIASPHWGQNNADAPSRPIRRLARALIDAGVDAILGHSAHVIQGVEVYQERPIVYDMGSLIYDRGGEKTLSYSALFELVLDFSGVKQLHIHPIKLSRSRTSMAGEADARIVMDRIVNLSARLSRKTRWQFEYRSLVLELNPPSKTEQRKKPPSISTGLDVKQPHWESLAAGIEFGQRWTDVPSWLLEGPGVDMEQGFLVFGQQRAQQATIGYGFLVEVAFRCEDAKGRHWQASLQFAHKEDKGTRFSYKHPVSEGLWLSAEWKGEQVIKDSVVVRPPQDLPAGDYRVRWTLVDALSRRIWPAGSGKSPVGWVELGTIRFSEDGPKGVSGVDWATDLEWTPLDDSHRSRKAASKRKNGDSTY